MIIGIDCSRAFVTERTGTENYSYHLVTQLVSLPEAKSHIFVLFTRPNSFIPEGLRRSNVQILPITFPYLWTQVGLAWQTWKEPKLDVLWVPAHTLPVARRPGIKTVVTIHGLEYQWLPEYTNVLQRWYLPLSTMYAAAAADRLIAVSDFTAQQLIKELHTDPKKIKVIQEGVDAAQLSIPSLEKKKILGQYGLESRPYILFVGTIQPRKNLVALIVAFARFTRLRPDYRLVIAGGVGWRADEVLRSPGRQGVQEKVVFTGRVTDIVLQTLYGSATFYVQPSITEGFGLPVLEAMRMGVPVISSDGGALPEVVAGAGVIVPLGSSFVSDLVRSMQQLADDEAAQKTYAGAGRKRAASLTWRNAAQTTLQVLLK